METCIKISLLDYKIIKTKSSHYGIKLETKEKKAAEILYLDDKSITFICLIIFNSYKFMRTAQTPVYCHKLHYVII